MSVKQHLLNIVLIAIILNLFLSATLLVSVISNVQHRDQIDYNKMKTSEYQKMAAQYSALYAKNKVVIQEAQLRAFLKKQGLSEQQKEEQ